MKTGLVLEGGGLRGLYTAGVLDALLENGIDIKYVIGVSAGVCNGVSYVSGQKGRSCRINLTYVGDKRYLSFRNFIRTGSFFSSDFAFHEIPDKLDRFDIEAFLRSEKEFVSGVTDVATGKPVYFDKSKGRYINDIACASSAIPVFAKIVEFEGGRYLDGGTSDPIPVKKALEDGCGKVVVVLTRDRKFIRQPESGRMVYRRAYRRYPAMIRALDNRHVVYNKNLELLRQLEAEGKALVLAPRTPVAVGRFEKDKTKLKALYDQGVHDTVERIAEIRDFIE